MGVPLLVGAAIGGLVGVVGSKALAPKPAQPAPTPTPAPAAQPQLVTPPMAARRESRVLADVLMSRQGSRRNRRTGRTGAEASGGKKTTLGS